LKNKIDVVTFSVITAKRESREKNLGGQYYEI